MCEAKILFFDSFFLNFDFKNRIISKISKTGIAKVTYLLNQCYSSINNVFKKHYTYIYHVKLAVFIYTMFYRHYNIQPLHYITLQFSVIPISK